MSYVALFNLLMLSIIHPSVYNLFYLQNQKNINQVAHKNISFEFLSFFYPAFYWPNYFSQKKLTERKKILLMITVLVTKLSREAINSTKRLWGTNLLSMYIHYYFFNFSIQFINFH